MYNVDAIQGVSVLRLLSMRGGSKPVLLVLRLGPAVLAGPRSLTEHSTTTMLKTKLAIVSRHL
jgi:hypothetical protein